MMKKKTTLIVILLALVLLLAGAYMLYDKLGQDLAPGQMIVHATQQPTASESPTEEPTPEPTAAPTDEPTSEPEPPAEPVADTEQPAATEPVGEPEATEDPHIIHAPDFRVYDKDGNIVRLSDFFGKPIVLNFWASWCGPCKSEMPDFNAKSIELEGEVQFLMINMTDGARETIETASAFIDQNGCTFPVFFDTTSEAALTYGAYSLPTSFFINAQGHVIAQAVGAINAATLQRGIDMITD